MSPLAFATVFDGDVPASLNPGVDPGAPVVAWTPDVSGIYQLMLSAPDEAGAPFMFADNIIVDLNAAVSGIQAEPSLNGSITDEFQQEGPFPGPSLKLETFRGAAVRAVVKVALVAASDVGSAGESLVVPLDELKRGLGIAIDDASEDENLAQLEAQAVAWVEEKLERRFQAPEDRKVYVKGTGSTTLFLWGNVEDMAAGSVVIRERSVGGGGWEAIEDPDEVFEVRHGKRIEKLERIDGSVWARGMEYEISFADGYTVAPADIKALIIDAVNQQRNALIAINDEGTIKSETIGDYSYTLDLGVASAALSAGFSSTSSDTINRWRRVHR